VILTIVLVRTRDQRPVGEPAAETA
jgi:hypothetical protein